MVQRKCFCGSVPIKGHTGAGVLSLMGGAYIFTSITSITHTHTEDEHVPTDPGTKSPRQHTLNTMRHRCSTLGAWPLITGNRKWNADTKGKVRDAKIKQEVMNK